MIKNIPVTEQPRERMLHYGAKALTVSELLAILLRTGSKKRSALELGQYMASQFESNLSDLSQITIEQLCEIDGIGTTKATQIIAAIELGKRIKQSTGIKGYKITSPSDVTSFFYAELSLEKVEKFVIVMLNTKNEVINWEVISIGSLNASIVHPREVFNSAIKRSAASIIAIHNHPSGTVSPSKEDSLITKRLDECGQLLGIPLVDHLIIGKDKYFSFKESNQL